MQPTFSPTRREVVIRTTNVPLIESEQFWNAIAIGYLIVGIGNQFLGDSVLTNGAHMLFGNPQIAEWFATNAKFLIHPVIDAMATVGFAASMMKSAFSYPR